MQSIDEVGEVGKSIRHVIPPGVVDAFEIRPPSVPKTANAIFDEQMGGCIG
ncbi:hypothetical protein [Paracidovorax anthurii]|uniref:hypothetical protein n=1 Tax=Paracidovorax anthurii TaxID=78229 RepID=UPI00147507BE|nr:hypothetical protein [Paracidovorax anthurii]